MQPSDVVAFVDASKQHELVTKQELVDIYSTASTGDRLNSRHWARETHLFLSTLADKLFIIHS